MHITGLVQKLDIVPNATYFTGAAEAVLKQILRELAIRAQGYYEVRMYSDAYGIYLRIQHPQATNSLVWVSHIDHPAIVFDHKGRGFPLGSVGGIERRGIDSIKDNVYPIDIFDSSGKFILTADCAVEGDKLSMVKKLPGHQELVGMWQVGLHSDENFIQMRSADNHIPTISALLALESLVNVEVVFDITLILNSVEEIYQLSMTRQMLRDGIPEVGIKFTDQTIFIVLEAMEMIGVQNTGLPQPNYTDGVLIKVNDAHVVYGQLSSSDSNLAEAMLLTVLKSSDRRYQHTASLGTSDATAIAALSPFPNIACLAIPCQNKHNVATDGAIVAEKVLTYDVHSAIEVLGKMATMQELEPLQELLSVSLKNSDLVSHPTIKAAANARKRLLKHNAPRIEHRFFLSNSLWRKALLARTRLK